MVGAGGTLPWGGNPIGIVEGVGAELAGEGARRTAQAACAVAP